MNLPKSRNHNIVVQELGKEILIYDLAVHKSFNLNETSSIIYNHCDGQTSFAELKRRYKFTDDLINFALDELQANALLQGERPKCFAGMTRREVVRKVGLASLIALPIVASLVAPSAAQAASATCIALNQMNCIFNNNTQSNCCPGLRCENPGFTSCVNCIPTNDVFYPIGNGGTVADCNARTERNRCCNTTDNSVVSGSTCLCP